MLILYRERDLDEAYKIDCKARTKGNQPWIKREDFRNIYEALLDTYFTNSVEKKLEKKEQDVAEYVIEQVNKAQALIVNREEYKALVETRTKVCPAYANVKIDRARTLEMPENGVPQQLLACAQHLPETENISITAVGSKQLNLP